MVQKNFFPFIKNKLLRDRLLVEFINARIIYKLFEGLQAQNELLLAQVKTQVVMYVSIQEAVINYILFDKYDHKDEVTKLLYQVRYIPIDIPRKQKEFFLNNLNMMEKSYIFTIRS